MLANVIQFVKSFQAVKIKGRRQKKRQTVDVNREENECGWSQQQKFEMQCLSADCGNV